MPNIEVSTSTARDVRLLAKAWQVSDDDVIRRLLDRFATGGNEQRPSSADGKADPGAAPGDRPEAKQPERPAQRWQRRPVGDRRQIAIHVEYLAVRTTAVFDRISHEVTITSGPLAGRSFTSPSGAAAALIRSQNPGVSTERNGWQFWVASETGAPISTIRT